MECANCDKKALYRVTSYYADDEYGGISRCTNDICVCKSCLAKMERLYSELEYEKP